MNKESWGFLHTSSSDPRATWTQNMTNGHQRVMLRLNDFPQGAKDSASFGPLHLFLWTPLFPWNLSTRLFIILFMGGILLVLGYCILRYMVQKIYALPSFFHRSHELETSPVSPTHFSLRHLFVLGPPGSGKSQLARTLGPGCHVLDFHETYGKESWAEAMASSLSEHPTAVLLDHFEYQWEDLNHRKEKGVLLELLLARGLKVCIFSTKDPLEWTRAPKLGLAEIPQDAMQAYWIDLLGSFGFIHFTPSRMEALLQEWLHPRTESHEATGQTLSIKQCLIQESLPPSIWNELEDGYGHIKNGRHGLPGR